MSTASGVVEQSIKPNGCPSGLAPAQSDPIRFQIDPSAFVKKKNNEYTLDVLVRGAKCGGCLSKIENNVSAIDGVDTVRMNLTTGRLRASWTSKTLDPTDILLKLKSLGYGATPFDPDEAKEQHSKREKQLLMAMAVAGFATANVMLLSVSVWAGVGEMNSVTREFLHWISACIAIPVVMFSGRPFFESALTAIRSGHVNMDVPISLAVCLAIGMSIFETIHHGEHTYFDAAVMLLFFLLIGRFLDAKLQREAQSAARDLALMQAVSVTKIKSNNVAESVKASSLVQGDIIQIAAGERFAVDAEILTGNSDLDTHMVTGESTPITSSIGQKIYAGTINLSQAITAKVLASADDSMLAEVSKLLETGEQKRSTYRQIADKAAKLYVPIVHTVAASAFIGWVLYNGDIKNAIFVAIAVLIITCPCALALAAPVVQVVAVGKLFRRSVYLKSGDALERIAACDHVIFDKTGTLTKPEASLATKGIDPIVLENAAKLARGSRHPYSRALVDAVGAGEVAEDIEEVSGAGVKGLVNGQAARLGSAKWILGEDTGDASANCLYFKIGDKNPIAFEFNESEMEGALQIAKELSSRDIDCEILSGDAPDKVQNFADAAGISVYTASVSPVDKAARIAQLDAEGKKVLMIGDGLNDAGALANAHASLTPGGAVDISRAAGDGVYSGENIGVISDIIDTCRQSKSRMLENFGFAALYNMVAIPFAVLGFVTPLFAAIAMSGSSLIVTLNALRLNLDRK
ncbi:heavy metal translocating P-type ATPase [Hirschia maritima]|uniref:heavy metal translocating P-type ATPase n=1 Tax=Hirschia maritima TaxID=1121961 RepID=UPI000377BF68|nr:heavy metal translocating P-type ATPase [Hirschia maritima]